MHRSIFSELQNWANSKPRKPLVLRGARQVGKTWLVRALAVSSGLTLLELNFEKNPQNKSLFASNDPKIILQNLSAALHQTIDPSRTLLFLDEVQAAPELLAQLRWFAEDMPELAVIAAGSLLEFVFSDHTFSMPVGRIRYLHVEPLSFEEFLLAQKMVHLHQYLVDYQLGSEIPQALHQQLTGLFKEYVVVGGMPEAVQSWIDKQSLIEVSQIQRDLLATYRSDFAKYRGRIALERLEEAMAATPRFLGSKYVFSHVNPAASADVLRRAVHLLNQARVCHRVVSCAANGVPLLAETKEKFFKEIFLDVGLACAALGLSLHQLNQVDDLMLVNSGAIAEQVTGQLLRTIDPPFIEPALYYWLHDKAGAQAELDYVIQHANQVIPIEVKAGASGTLKSLHLFMGLKNSSRAVRVYSGACNLTRVKTIDRQLGEIQYDLISIPFYLLGQLHRLLAP